MHVYSFVVSFCYRDNGELKGQLYTSAFDSACQHNNASA